jgi:filamentous hemagglutinin
MILLKWTFYTKMIFTKVVSYSLVLILVLSNFITSYAIASSIVPDRSISGNKVYIDKSANQTPVVNINDPNAAGVSHNHFVDFNVGSNGAIINNSQVNATSHIGGVVLGNSNLNSSANTIINEVTGSGRSQINGPQEILGMKANYVLANPNGISINGGEFINAHSVTLTTGQVQLNSLGELEKLLVVKGAVEINDKNLDVSKLDYFDIIARSVKLNAAIHAVKDEKLEASKDVDVQITTGAGEYNVKNKTFKVSRAAVSSPPSFSIDSSQLGGLYAGKIKLVSSEDGVGVNIPDLQSTNGDIEITSEGKIVHKTIKSTGQINIKSNKSKIIAASDSEISSDGATFYHGKEGVEIQNNVKLTSQGSVELESSDGAIHNYGSIIARGEKGIAIKAKGVENHGKIITTFRPLGSISINSEAGILNNGLITTDLNFNSIFKSNFINNGKIQSKNAVFIGNNFENTDSSEIKIKEKLSVNLAGNFSNLGKVYIFNTGSGKIVTGADFINKGLISDSSSLIIDAGNDILNTGSLGAIEQLFLTSKNNKQITDR